MNRHHPIIALLLLAGSTTAFSADKGRSIFDKMEERETGFKDSIVEATMLLKTKTAKASKRKFTQYALEGKNNQDKGKVVFSTPKYMNKTALLTHAHEDKDDDQWLYMPASKRVKRIAASNQTGAFVGSEFTYEDLKAPILDKYTYKYLKDEKVGKHDCYVVERKPKSKNSGYTKQIYWIHKKFYRIHKVEYYDRKKSKLKTLVTKNFTKYEDKYWRPEEERMTNHQTGKSTILQFGKFKFKQGLKESDFSKNALK